MQFYCLQLTAHFFRQFLVHTIDNYIFELDFHTESTKKNKANTEACLQNVNEEYKTKYL